MDIFYTIYEARLWTRWQPLCRVPEERMRGIKSWWVHRGVYEGKIPNETNFFFSDTILLKLTNLRFFIKFQKVPRAQKEFFANKKISVVVECWEERIWSKKWNSQGWNRSLICYAVNGLFYCPLFLLPSLLLGKRYRRGSRDLVRKVKISNKEMFLSRWTVSAETRFFFSCTLSSWRMRAISFFRTTLVVLSSSFSLSLTVLPLLLGLIIKYCKKLHRAFYRVHFLFTLSPFLLFQSSFFRRFLDFRTKPLKLSVKQKLDGVIFIQTLVRTYKLIQTRILQTLNRLFLVLNKNNCLINM